MAGYSNKSLKEKLGIKDGDLLVANPHRSYAKLVGDLDPNQIIEVLDIKSLKSIISNRKFNFIHAFFKTSSEFKEHYFVLKNALEKNGMLWVSWPKKSSEIKSDLNENIIRDFALENGLVDVKVCAIDEDWSGLKLVFRLQDR